MDDNDGSRSIGQPVTFIEDMNRAELEQEIARRTAEHFSTRALRAALFPQHEGIMEQPDGYAHVQGECGDLITFYLRIDDERIAVVAFTTDGCDATIAAGEMLATIVTGLALEEAVRITPDDLLEALDGMPPNHAHCTALAVKTLRAAIASYHGKTNAQIRTFVHRIFGSRIANNELRTREKFVQVTVASGKGGTGKTTVATSLALSLAIDPVNGISPVFLDCDVEAPNAHLFLDPIFEHREDVNILIPEVDEAGCTYCGNCAEVCPWHAIAVVGQKVLVFPQLCHGCGSCTLACPEGAIREIPNPIGVTEAGPAREGIGFARGVLNIGEPMAVPVIRQLKKRFPNQPTNIATNQSTNQPIIIDASPGTTCPVVESMRGADFVLLVTEPTPFGLHDLRLAVQVTQELGIPAGVVINRDGVGDTGVDDYCRESGLPILMRIPLDQRIAQGIARGVPLIDILPEYARRFRSMYAQIVLLVAREQR